MALALDETPDIISMSAGTTTRSGWPLVSMEIFWRTRLSRVKGTVLVAAAGNDGDRGPFWPAAFPWSVSVGAVEPDGSRAGFSNYGSWVDVYALGVDVVNAYPRGPFTYSEPPFAGQSTNFLTGLANWSGTSFSTPLVAGLIAARMSWSGESARESADALLRVARERALGDPRQGAVTTLHAGDSAPRWPVA
jgi:subtilisin family serine protease